MTSNLYKVARYFASEDSLLTESEKWHTVSLRLTGDRLPVERVGSVLRLIPEYVGRKGDHIRGNPRYAKHKTNIWTHGFTKNDSVSFERQLTVAVRRLERVKLRLARLLERPGIQGEFLLGFGSGNGQGGCTFSPSLLRRIAALGLTVSLDLYPPDIDRRPEVHAVRRAT